MADTYRHRISIDVDNGVPTQNDYGDTVEGFAEMYANVPAAWLAGPGQEFRAAESLRSQVTGRFMFRWFPNDMRADNTRVRWDGKTFDVKGVQVDSTARREITLLVAELP